MKYNSSRRYAIKCGLALLGGAALPLSLGSTRAYAATHQRVCVSVHGPDGRHLLVQVTVTLKPVGGGPAITLAPEGTLPPVLYGGDVPEGEYTLTVANVGDLWAPSCTITVVGEQGGCIGVFMLPLWWECLFYRIGRSLIPFQYDRSVLGVLVPGQAAAPETAKEYAKKFAVHGLERFLAEPHDPQSWIAAQDYIWLFSVDLPVRASDAEVATAREAAADAIRREFQDDPRFVGLRTENIRIGAPTQLYPGYVKILDTRYVVRFSAKTAINEARRWIEGGHTNAKVLRRLSHASGAYLIEFLDHDHPRHLRQVEIWLRSGQFLYIEPDLIVELQQHTCPSLPNDGVAPCQEGIRRMRVPEAWCLLESKLGAGQKYGGSSVCVGLIEFPADPTHSDLDTAQIAYCHGFNWSMPCYRTTSTGSGLELKAEFLESDGIAPSHGTWVFGVGGAVTGNSQGVAGIAPTPVKVIAVPPSGVAITTYCEMVLWLAGLGIPHESSAPLLGAPGSPPAADVISCSHGVGLMPTPAQVCDTFARVTDEGRSGKGTVLVYSAGNGNSPIENVQAFADDPHVVAVGATMVAGTADGGVIEKRWVESPWGSNYGESLDLCAVGANVPTLDPHAGVTYSCTGVSHSRVSAQTGTSLAAPAVSAACALMLTVNSELWWCHVRDLLRKSARRPLSASDPDLQEPGTIWANDRNPYFGSGRLDAYAAVSEALDFTPEPDEKKCMVSCNYTATCASTDVCKAGPSPPGGLVVE